MSPFPQELTDRWNNRSENHPGEGTLYWHILLGENQKLRNMVANAHGRLSKFSGLHLTPLRWLHITTHIIGRANQIDNHDMSQMVEAARATLADRAPIHVTFQSVFYHPEAIVLGAHPQEALAPIRQAAVAATLAVTGKDAMAPELTQPWTPHVTLCYSTGRQPTAPIIAALGTDLPPCQVSIQSLSLVIQRGPERLWDWHHIGTAHLGTSDLH